MPKSSSKKKKEKNADFQKTKLKVGKKKAVDPSQNTDTSFKSKSIIIPNQSIVNNNNSNESLVNSKNTSLPTLLAQLNHHNSGVKKDALSGVGDLISLHPQILGSQLSLILDAINKLYLDEDGTVRKKLLQFLTSYIAPIDKKSIDWTPFLHSIVIYISSAMTHIFEDIRQDSIKFLNIWLSIEPTLAIKFMDQILPNYLSLLRIQNFNLDNAAQAGLKSLNQSKQSMWSPTTRVEILNSLYQFLRQVTAFDLPDNWYWKSWVQSDLKLVFEDCTIIEKHHHLLSSSSSLQNHLSFPQLNQLIKHLNSLFPFLVSTWVELASTQFQHYNLSQKNTPVSLETLAIILQLLTLQGRLTNSLSQQNDFHKIQQEWLIQFQSIQKSVLIYFPFFDEIQLPTQVQQLVTNMNVMACELVGQYWLYQMDQKNTNESDSESGDNQLDSIFLFVSDLFSELNQNRINLDLFKMVTPAIWWLMNTEPNAIGNGLFKSLFKFSTASKVVLSVKLNCLQFLWRILQIQSHSHYTGKFYLSDSIRNEFETWLSDLVGLIFTKTSNVTDTSNKWNEYYKTSLQILNWSLIHNTNNQLSTMISSLEPRLEHWFATDNQALFQLDSIENQTLLIYLIHHLPQLTETLKYQLNHWSQQKQVIDSNICNQLNQLIKIK